MILASTACIYNPAARILILACSLTRTSCSINCSAATSSEAHQCVISYWALMACMACTASQYLCQMIVISLWACFGPQYIYFVLTCSPADHLLAVHIPGNLGYTLTFKLYHCMYHCICPSVPNMIFRGEGGAVKIIPKMSPATISQFWQFQPKQRITIMSSDSKGL